MYSQRVRPVEEIFHTKSADKNSEDISHTKKGKKIVITVTNNRYRLKIEILTTAYFAI